MITLPKWTGVHIYRLDNLAGHGTPDLLMKKYLKILILKYMDSIFHM